MIVSHRYKFIFFHNPLTGTLALRQLLEQWNDEHIVDYRDRTAALPLYHNMSPNEAFAAFNAMGLDFQGYSVVTCVRSPFTRLPALYRRMDANSKVWRLRRLGKLPVPTFDEWLESTRPDGIGAGGRPSQRWRRCGSWTARHWCDNKVTAILKSEDLLADFARLATQLGLPVARGALPDPMVDDPELSALLTPGSVRMISERYAEDIATYGYCLPANAAADLPA